MEAEPNGSHIFGTRDAAQAAGEDWLIEARGAAGRRARAGHPDPTGSPTFYFIRSLQSGTVVFNSLDNAVSEAADGRPAPPFLVE